MTRFAPSLIPLGQSLDSRFWSPRLSLRGAVGLGASNRIRHAIVGGGSNSFAARRIVAADRKDHDRFPMHGNAPPEVSPANPGPRSPRTATGHERASLRQHSASADTDNEEFSRQLAELLERAETDLNRALHDEADADAPSPTPSQLQVFPLPELHDVYEDSGDSGDVWAVTPEQSVPEQPGQAVTRPTAEDAAEPSQGAQPDAERRDPLQSLELEVEFQLGRTRLAPPAAYSEPAAPGHVDRELPHQPKPGDVLTLEQLLDDPIDIVVEGRVIGRGEVLIVDDCLSVRVVELL